MSAIRVKDAAELASAIKAHAAEIEVDGVITGSPMITLSPGTTLRGGTLRFNARGIRLTSNNTLEDVVVETPLHETAILNDTSVDDLGTLTLRNVTTRG
ncbi:hypothetical protein [Corynebacterium lubricantis]|uniref:hypothetical protein n=1 Tax=Corynebacterium lubricantis TaxID=541095 RepID=UPI0003644959|nr:hypothetical protein [Corynebacterium lubricantis]